MRYSDDTIREVIDQTDIVEIISERVQLKRKGANYFGLCPFHNEKTPSFSVSPGKQMYYCFGCHKGGNVVSFLMEYERWSFPETIKYLADRIGIHLPAPEQTAAQKEKADLEKQLLEVNKTAATYFYRKLRMPCGKNAMEYLTKRGLTKETMQRFGLGYADKYSDDLYQYMKKKGYEDRVLKECGLFHYDPGKGFTDKFWNRVMFPIMDRRSRVIGFGGRVMGEGKPKYLNSPETVIFNKRKNLYGIHEAQRTKKNYLIICEGYMDVISLHQAGYTNAVASLGTALTEEQCHLMGRLVKEVRVIYDMDGAGVSAALRAIPMFRDEGVSTRVVNLRPHKDPDEFIQAEGGNAFEKRLDEAQDSFAFITDRIDEKYDLKVAGERSLAIHESCQAAAQIKDDINRQSVEQYLSQRYSISGETIRDEVEKERASVEKREKNASALDHVRRPDGERKGPPKVSAAKGREDAEQRLMLTMLVENPWIISNLKGYLSPEDFTNPLCRSVADMIWKQAPSGAISETSIVSQFEKTEDQAEVVSFFHTELDLPSEEEKKKAFEDVLFRMKRKSIETRMESIDKEDMAGFMKIVDERKKLDSLQAAGLPEDIFRSERSNRT